MDEERDIRIKAISKEALGCIERVAVGAEESLRNYVGPKVTALASLNTWTDAKQVAGVRKVGETARDALKELAREPVIARITVEGDDGRSDVIYITRASPPTLPNRRSLTSASGSFGNGPTPFA